MEQRGPASGSPPQPHNGVMLRGPPKHAALQDSLWRRWQFYHQFTSKLSHGAVEHLPRDLWANSARSQTQVLCPSRHSLGLARFLDQCRKTWQITSLWRAFPIPKYWLDKHHLTLAEEQQQVQTQVSMKKTFLLLSSATGGQ